MSATDPTPEEVRQALTGEITDVVIGSFYYPDGSGPVYEEIEITVGDNVICLVGFSAQGEGHILISVTPRSSAVSS